ncbi:MAG: hypothetical protein WDO13_03685 [Verrucomicrobiota bacterium]
MPERSALMLIVFAATSASTAATSTPRGTLRRSAPARPRPETIPTRAHIICTAAISGQVSSAVHSSVVPNCAPATV